MELLTFAEVGDGLLDGALGVVDLGDVRRHDEHVRRAEVARRLRHRAQGDLRPRRQRHARPLLRVLVHQMLQKYIYIHHVYFIFVLLSSRTTQETQ